MADNEQDKTSKANSRSSLSVGDSTAIGGDVTGRDHLIAGGHIVQAGPGSTVIISSDRAAQAADDAPGPGVCPFKGLHAFREEDSDLFFGRETVVAQLLSFLRGISAHVSVTVNSQSNEQSRFLAIVGPSGSGKSSLVRAGLVPAMRRGEIPGSDSWHIHLITPTARPIESLAVSLTPKVDSLQLTATLNDDLKADHRNLHLAARRILDSEINETRLVIVIDQFEELFTLCYDDDERKQFIANLLYAANATGGQTIVVLTIRADFYPRCALYPNLRHQITQPQVLVGPMDEVELRRAIELPVERTGWEYEPGLVDTILTDIEDSPGALPLLQHALLETWKRRRGRVLTLEGYQASGGVRGAIAQRAELIYASLPIDAQAIVRRIMLRLTQPGEGTEDTRRRADLAELIPHPKDEAAVLNVLNVLAEARLIITDAKSVDVGHEALIRGWPRLRQWLDEDREAVQIQHRLAGAAKAWARANRDDSELYRGARLVRAIEWAEKHNQELSDLENEFLAASRRLQVNELEAAKRRTLQLRQLTLYLTVALILAVVLTGVAISLGNEARAGANRNAVLVTEIVSAANTAEAGEVLAQTASTQAAEQRDEAQRQTRLALSRQLANQSASFRTSDPELALLLAMEAVHSTYQVDNYATLESLTVLRVLLAEQQGPLPLPIQVLMQGRVTGAFRAVFDPDGHRIASAGQDGVARIWDALTGEEIVQLIGHGDGLGTAEARVIQGIAFSPSGKMIATAGWDSTARIWDAETGRELAVLRGHAGKLVDVAFDPTGTVVATSGATEGAVRLWSVNDGRLLFVLKSSGWINRFDFSPTGDRLVVAGADGAVQIWSVSTGTVITTLQGEGAMVNALFDPTGNRVVGTGWDGASFVWDAQTGARLATLKGHKGLIWGLAYSPDGTRVVTSAEDGTARIWDAQSGRELAVLRGHGGTIFSVNFSPKGDKIVTGSADGTVRVWDAETGSPIAILPDYIGAKSLFNLTFGAPAENFSVGDATIFSTYVEGVTTISSDQPLDLPWVFSVSFDPSGEYVAAASLDGSVKTYLIDIDKLLEAGKSQVTRKLTCDERVLFLYENLRCSSESTPSPVSTITVAPAQ